MPTNTVGTIDLGGDGREILLSMVNDQEGLNLSLNDFEFENPVLASTPDPIRNTVIKMVPKASSGYYGKRTIWYNRIHISDIGIIIVERGTATRVSHLLDKINEKYGIFIAPEDIIDAVLPAPGDTEEIHINFAPNSIVFYGGQKIVLGTETGGGGIPTAGELIAAFCDGYNRKGAYADGNGGATVSMILENSPDCGYVAPPELFVVPSRFGGMKSAEITSIMDGTGIYTPALTGTVALSNESVTTGKYYVEFYGLYNPMMIGVATESIAMDNYIGRDAFGWAIQTEQGKVYHNGAVVADYFVDVHTQPLGLLIDADAQTIRFYASKADGTGSELKAPISLGLPANTPLYLAIGGNEFSEHEAAVVVNFGKTEFDYAPIGSAHGFGTPAVAAYESPVYPNILLDIPVIAGSKHLVDGFGAFAGTGLLHGNTSKGSGKHYWEMMSNGTGTVGVVQMDVSGNLGTYFNVTQASLGYTGINGDVLGLYLDVTAGTLGAILGGTDLGIILTGITGSVTPAIDTEGEDPQFVYANFGQVPFENTVPAGYTSGLLTGHPAAGTVLGTYCAGFNNMVRLANGTGGQTIEVLEEDSVTCGYVALGGFVIPSSFDPGKKSTNVQLFLDDTGVYLPGDETTTVLSKNSITSGRHYVEFYGLNQSNPVIGVATANVNLSLELGQDEYGWGLRLQNSRIYHNGVMVDNTYAGNKIVGLLIDADTKILQYYITDPGSAHPIVVGYAELDLPANTPIYIAVSGINTGSYGLYFAANFGKSPFTSVLDVGTKPGFGPDKSTAWTLPEQTHCIWDITKMSSRMRRLGDGSGVVFTSGAFDIAYGTKAMTAGKYYWEIDNAYFRIVGIANSTHSVGYLQTEETLLGYDTQTWAIQSGGAVHNNATIKTNVRTDIEGEVGGECHLGFYLDMDAGTLGVILNGTDKGVVFSGITGSIVPAVNQWGGSGTKFNEVFFANFGKRPFKNTVPAGYIAGVPMVDPVAE